MALEVPPHRKHRLDDLRTGNRAAQFGGHLQPMHRQPLLRPFHQTVGRTIRQALQLAVNRHQGLRLVVLFHPPGSGQLLADALLMLPGQVIEDIAFPVHLAALDGNLPAKGLLSCFRQCCASIKDAQILPGWAANHWLNVHLLQVELKGSGVCYCLDVRGTGSRRLHHFVLCKIDRGDVSS